MDTLREQVAIILSEQDELSGQELEDDLMAVFAERERQLRERIEACRWLKPDEPNSRIADDVYGWRAWRSHEKAIDAALGVFDS